MSRCLTIGAGAGNIYRCKLEAGHSGGCDPESVPVTGFPCPHGCTDHTVKSQKPTDCGHYHSPSEWGHHEQKHNSEYWKAIGELADEKATDNRLPDVAG